MNTQTNHVTIVQNPLFKFTFKHVVLFMEEILQVRCDHLRLLWWGNRRRRRRSHMEETKWELLCSSQWWFECSILEDLNHITWSRRSGGAVFGGSHMTSGSVQ